MFYKIEYTKTKKERIVAVADIEASELDKLKKDLKEKDLAEVLREYDFDNIKEESCTINYSKYKDFTTTIYYALLTFDEVYGSRLVFITKDKEEISEAFTKNINKRADELEEEGCGHAIFKDGSELWVIEILGKDIDADNVFAVFGEEWRGFQGWGVFESFNEAKEELLLLGESYTKDGLDIAILRKDSIVFVNDDYWKIAEVPTKLLDDEENNKGDEK